MKNELLKEAFIEATTSKRIEILCNDKLKDYWDIQFKDGGIIISHKKQIANISNLEYFDLAPIIPSPGIPLVAKVNLNNEKNQTKLQENLEKINTATGQGINAIDTRLKY